MTYFKNNNLKVLFLFSSILFLVFDQVTKFVVSENISLSTSVPIIENFFSLNHQYNTGISFGFLSQLPQPWGSWALGCISFAIIVGISTYSLRIKNAALVEIFSYSAIVGGAMGNLYDRIVRGAVVDWLRFHYFGKFSFPTFNLADAFIVCGVFLILGMNIKPTYLEKSKTDIGK